MKHYSALPRIKRGGFTLIEVVIAAALLTIVLTGVFSAIVFSYSSSVSSEQLNTAKNIANYTIEYLRSRNVTHSGSVQDLDPSATWYTAPGANANALLPGIVDLAGDPLDINAHPSAPGESDPNSKKSVWSCLQGYVSLHDNPQHGDVCEDANGDIKNNKGTWKYMDNSSYPAEAGRWDPYCIRFPLDGLDSANCIMGFSASSAYMNSQWKLYGTSAVGDRHFSNSQAVKADSRSYHGFRIFTMLTARSRDLSTDYRHVEYYDVDVTVYWMMGTMEHSYALRTQIATY